MSTAPDPALFRTQSSVGNTFRTQIILVLDASGSMNTKTSRGKTRIEELSAAVRDFIRDDLKTLPIQEIGEIAIVAFNYGFQWLELGGSPVAPGSPFYKINDRLALAKDLEATGKTMMWQGINQAYTALDARTQQMNEQGLHRRFKTPICFLSDGEPSDVNMFDPLVEMVQGRSIDRRRGDTLFFGFGVHGADLPRLKQLAPYATYDLGQTEMRDVLRFVTASISNSFNASHGKIASDSRPTEVVVPFDEPDPAYGQVRRGTLNPKLYQGFNFDFE